MGPVLYIEIQARSQGGSGGSHDPLQKKRGKWSAFTSGICTRSLHFSVKIAKTLSCGKRRTPPSHTFPRSVAQVVHQ